MSEKIILELKNKIRDKFELDYYGFNSDEKENYWTCYVMGLRDYNLISYDEYEELCDYIEQNHSKKKAYEFVVDVPGKTKSWNKKRNITIKNISKMEAENVRKSYRLQLSQIYDLDYFTIFIKEVEEE